MREDEEDRTLKRLIAGEIPSLRRYARTLVPELSSADDLVQDSLERALVKRHQWRREGSIRGWLYTIMTRRFFNQKTGWMRWRRQVSLEADGEGAGAGAVLSQPARQDDLLSARDAVDAMAILPSEQRAAVALTVIEGFSYDEAARILRVPLGTLRSRLFRGRERLRELIVQKKAPVRLRRIK